MAGYNFSVVIPTRNRPNQLITCLRSIVNQSLPPDEVVVVNDGTISEENEASLNEIVGSGDFSFTLTSSDGLPGTSTAINTGVRRSNSDIVVTVADDMVLGDNYIERLNYLYQEHDTDKLAGIGNAGEVTKSASANVAIDLYRAFFYLNTDPWTINKAGMQKGGDINGLRKADYITGGGASYKRSVLLENPFQYWEGGREVHEDIELCWRLKNKGYYFLADPELPSEHRKGERHEEGWETGLKKGRNRVRMFQRNGQLRHTPLFLWACTGKVLSHFLSPILTHHDWRTNWMKGAGMGVGVIQQLPTLLDTSSSSPEEEIAAE